MMNLAEDPRAGLELLRYHSWAVHRSQSVGEHSCQIMRILLTVWPDCPRRMLVHAVTHDMGEMAGDAQYPYKQLVPGMKAAHDTAERMVTDRMAEVMGAPPAVNLTAHELHVFKIVEYVEMYEYGLRECNMGNKYGQVIAMRCLQAAGLLMGDKKYDGEYDVRPAIKRYIDTRMKWENFGNV